MYGNVNHEVDSYGFIGTLWGLTPQWSLVIFGDKSWMVAEAPNIPETHRKHEWSWSPSSMLSIAYGVKVTDPWLHRYDPSQIPQPPSKTQSARSDLANIAQKKAFLLNMLWQAKWVAWGASCWKKHENSQHLQAHLCLFICCYKFTKYFGLIRRQPTWRWASLTKPHQGLLDVWGLQCTTIN